MIGMVAELIGGGADDCCMGLAEENLDEATERRNVRCFWAIKCLMYLSAPVLYVDIVQAALCDKLGASKMVASLPASAYYLGAVAPFFAAWVVPSPARAKSVVLSTMLATASLLALVFLTLVLPFGASLRIVVVVAQGFILGLLAYTKQIFLWQCLASGTRLVARAQALKLAFSLGPLCAVAGSLAAQFILGNGISLLPYPHDFAFLYLSGSLVMLLSTVFAAGFRIPPGTKSPPSPPLLKHVLDGARNFVSRWDLVVLWIAYLLWFISLSGTANLSLYVGEAIGREPKDFSGLMLALRFGCKAAAGALLAMVLVRRGARTALAATAALLAGVYFWVFFASGYAYLLAFALVGAGELGTVYVSNYAISASPHERLTQNLALLELTSLFSSAGPALHGALTDAYGFKGSFALGLITGIISLALISILPARRSPRPAPQA